MGLTVISNTFRMDSQDSVLSSLLFNVYTKDTLDTVARRFIYAYHIALVTLANTFTALEQVLNADLKTLKKYFSK